MTLPLGRAPEPTYRLIPSKFPPIGLFDTVATAADLEAALDLVGWTNDRLVAERIALLPPADWVYGRPNASIVMAAFLHVAPGGMRFNAGDLGAWYAAADLTTAVAEVGHHLRREAVATSLPAMSRTYRCYLATLDGDHVDTRGAEDTLPGVFARDSYAASQPFGESIRASGHAGILYTSLRRQNGLNIAGYSPRRILDVRQGDHFEISVRASERRIDALSLTPG